MCNLVHDGESLWIFDWEECNVDGPVLCDQISFFLAVNRPRSLADHDALLDRFHSRFLGTNNSLRRVDVMLALAFRLTVNAQSASLIISRWDHSS
jgi:hypothetical protein